MPPLASRPMINGGASASAAVAHAHDLVHPETGLANDYLNIFNELVMLVEQLPSMPEFMDDVLAWVPVTYVEYFQRSSLPGSQRALEAYRKLDTAFRGQFESAIADIDRSAAGVISSLRQHNRIYGTNEPEALELICLRASAVLRELLAKAAAIVNHGALESFESAQHRADRLLAARVQSYKSV